MIEHAHDSPEVERWKQLRFDCITVDQLISPTPAFIYKAIIASDSSGICTATIYDGHDANGDRRIPMTCIDDYMWGLEFSTPVYFQYGIYVDVGDNVLGLMIHYLPVNE